MFRSARETTSFSHRTTSQPVGITCPKSNSQIAIKYDFNYGLSLHPLNKVLPVTILITSYAMALSHRGGSAIIDGTRQWDLGTRRTYASNRPRTPTQPHLMGHLKCATTNGIEMVNESLLQEKASLLRVIRIPGLPRHSLARPNAILLTFLSK